MNRQTTQEQLDDLLTQEISDEELKELLRRLGEIEFAWNPKTSIKDVVEATSADPLLIGRLLADIRKEDWEERFGLQVDDHEDRIERIEEEQRRTRRLLSLSAAARNMQRQTSYEAPAAEVDSQLEDPDEYFESTVSKHMRYFVYAVVACFAIAAIIFLAVTVVGAATVGHATGIHSGWR